MRFGSEILAVLRDHFTFAIELCQCCSGLRLDFVGAGVDEGRVVDLHDRVLLSLSPFTLGAGLHRGHVVQELNIERSPDVFPQYVWLADASHVEESSGSFVR